MENEIVEVRDGSLAGMAEFLRKEYKLPDNMGIRCRNRATGAVDTSYPITPEERERQRLDDLLTARWAKRAEKAERKARIERRWASRTAKKQAQEAV